ncbi:CsbD family protein [uncultured Desulfosarcina sp.]|uniref:CsbD family protein n=1 Tax=uncultured Desulfosarcina sp. TaxID=218289 RepID=UPI0029C6D402|nr:CsbD family protein [uncultured Desulfosarcina sp.]
MKPRTRDHTLNPMQQITCKLEEADEKMIVDRNLDAEGQYGHLNGKAQEKIDQVKKVVDKWRASFGTAKPNKWR